MAEHPSSSSSSSSITIRALLRGCDGLETSDIHYCARFFLISHKSFFWGGKNKARLQLRTKSGAGFPCSPVLARRTCDLFPIAPIAVRFPHVFVSP